MNVILVEPNRGLWKAGTFTRHSSFEPLGIGYIGAYLERAGYKVHIIQQRDKDKKILLKEVLDFAPDVVGISTMTYNADLSRWLCKMIKANNEKIITVLGGYHPSGAPEIIADENIDFAVIGEGEVTFLELIRSLRKGNGKYKKVKGIAYWDNGLKLTEKRNRLEALDSLPFPLRNKDILEDCKVNTLAYPSPSMQKCVAQVASSRGCPHRCSYCVSPLVWGRQTIYRSPENVVEEIKHLQNTYGTNFIFFSDLTFNLNQKKVNELCQAMIKNKLNINWFCMCYIDLFDQQLAEIMSEAGCTKIAFGIETFDVSISKKIKPCSSNKIDNIEEKIKLCDDLGILTRGYFMLGHPNESRETIENTISLLKRLPIDELKMAFITPFPGTQLASEIGDDLITHDYNDFTTDQPVVRINNFTPSELFETRERIFKEFYNSSQYERRMKNKIMRFPFLKQSYNEFMQFLNGKGIFNGETRNHKKRNYA